MVSTFGGPNPFTHGALAGLLAEINRKPRSPYEWAERFSHWAKAQSETEEAAIKSAERQVRQALEKCAYLADKTWKIIPQGSYRNHTNVRNDSDVDLCVCLMDVMYFDGPTGDVPTLEEIGSSPSPIRLPAFRASVHQALVDKLGDKNVKPGQKAIHINKENEDRVSVDVVPAIVHRLYGPKGNRGTGKIGIAFDVTTEGGGTNRIVNYPDQHYENGVAKNLATSRRYKRVVRILKRLRNHMMDNTDALDLMRAYARATPSFLIESLVYNCPDHLFVDDMYTTTVNVLRHIAAEMAAPSGTTALTMANRYWWQEVNREKFLFLGTTQPWSEATASQFVSAAMIYMEI